MKSHFTMNRSAAMACAVAGAATMLNGRCAAQSILAADYATNSIYNGGWSAGQNGGTGFGAWSFDGTDASPAGQYQGMSSSSALGTAWTLMDQASDSGMANCGRAISGGLQVGQIFQTIIQNPVNNAGTYSFRGFDILFTSGTNNDFPLDNTSALRLTVFEYSNPAMDWAISDADNSALITSASATTTGASGMLITFTLTSTNTYTLTMAPVSNPNNPYLTHSGTLVATSLPIDYVNFRLWNTASTGLTDTADNFEISAMTVQGTPPPSGLVVNAQRFGTNVVVSWTTNATNFVLASSSNLTNAVWNTNLPAPALVGNQNVVTNPISGPQQFYRLQATQ